MKKECYKKYVEEWNEEIQKKLFERYIKENGKHIKIITLKGEKIGFLMEKILTMIFWNKQYMYIIRISKQRNRKSNFRRNLIWK